VLKQVPLRGTWQASQTGFGSNSCQSPKEKVISTLLEAINNAVVTSNSFYGQFSYVRDTTGGIESVVVSVSEGQGSGTPTKGSGVIAIEKKSKLQVLELVEQVGTKQSMGVNYSLWTFVNLTQQLRK